MIDVLRERLGTCATIMIIVSEIGLFADEAEQKIAFEPTLADARVENGRFLARVRADDHQRIGLLDARDRRIEDVARAAEFGMKFRSVLPAIDRGDAEALHQQLQREHLFDGAEIAGDGADFLRARRFDLRRDGGKGFRPCGFAQLAVFAQIRPVEPLRLEAIDDLPRLVGNPFLVHRVVDARQDAHHFAPARIDADRGAERIHHIDEFGLGQLPGARLEGIGLRQQRADGAEIGDIALQLGVHRGFEIGRDLHVFAAADRAHVARAGDFRGESHAARAMDAAIHRGAHERADIFVFDRALILGEARGIDAEGHGLILQIAFAALIADRAIERMIDEQKFHHAMARFFHHRRFGEDDRAPRHSGPGADRAPPWRRRRRAWRAALHFDETHAAIAGNREALVIAEARDLGAGLFAGLAA